MLRSALGRRSGVVVLFLGLLAAHPTVARAQTPVCTGNAAAVSVTVSPSFVGGRDLVWGSDHDIDSVTVSAADPARPIARPGTLDIDYPDDRLSGVIKSQPGDGPIAVSFNYSESIAGSSCVGTVGSVVSQPVAGKRARPTIRWDDRSLGWLQVGFKDELDAEDCAVQTLDRVTLTLSGKQRARYTLGDVCGDWKDSHTGQVNGPYLQLKHHSYNDPGEVEVELDNPRKPGVHAITYVLRSGTHTIRKGRLWIRVRVKPGYDIYEEADDFVNVCINDGYEIRSRGGRLYCHIGNEFIRTLFLDGKRPPT